MLWSGELVVAAETAFLLGCADVGRAVRRLLGPFADLASFNGVWVVAPVAYGAALAAAAAGEKPAPTTCSGRRSRCATGCEPPCCGPEPKPHGTGPSSAVATRPAPTPPRRATGDANGVT